MNIVFRVDASLDIGTGHVMRCLTLADALREQGAECHFICREHPGNLLGQIHESRFTTTALLKGESGFQPTTVDDESLPVHAAWLGCDWRSDADATREVVQPIQPDWLIVDHYALAREWEEALQGCYRKLMVIDDLADRAHTADIVVDQTLGRHPDDYAEQVQATTVRLTGSRYALLRPEFAQWRAAALTRRTGQCTPHHLLINLGGVDAASNMPRILAVAADYWAGPIKAGPITVVMGAASPALAEVRQIIHDTHGITLEIGTTDMAGLLSKADLAIGAAGTSAWERCALGLPTLMLTCADNQRQIAEALHDAGAAIKLGDAHQLKAADLHRALDAIVEPETYQRMCWNAANVCDGYGTLRVRMAMAAPDFEKTVANQLALRPAAHWDAEYLFYLQTRPGVRDWSVNPQAPSWQEHQTWCRQRLNASESGLYIVYNAVDAVGMVRFDRLDDTSTRGAAERISSKEISLIVDPGHAGQGWGAQAVKIAIGLQSASRVMARIHPRNKPSQRVFEKAGFRYQNEHHGFQNWLLTSSSSSQNAAGSL